MEIKTEKLEDINSKYYGGSFTYLQIVLNLSLLIKLLKIKISSANIEKIHSYKTLLLLTKSIQEQSNIMIEKDAEIFETLKKIKDNKELDEYIDKIFSSSLAFLENLNTLDIFINKLIEETTSSLKYDFIFIKESLHACYNNLVHILEYATRKITNLENRNYRFIQIQAIRKE